MLSIHIKIYFWSFVYRHYQQMYFYNWNFTLSYCFFCKMKIRITLSKNTPGSIRCPYFASLTIFLEFICLLYARVTSLECQWLCLSKFWTISIVTKLLASDERISNWKNWCDICYLNLMSFSNLFFYLTLPLVFCRILSFLVVLCRSMSYVVCSMSYVVCSM